jgi:hypothetical protein
VKSRKVEIGNTLVTKKPEFEGDRASDFLQVTEKVVMHEETQVSERSFIMSETVGTKVIELVDEFFRNQKLVLPNNCEMRREEMELLKRSSWLTDNILDFFTSYVVSEGQSKVNFLSCAEAKVIHKRISTERIQEQQTRKRKSRVPCEPIEGVVGYLNWNNMHWGVICYHVKSQKFYFFESTLSYSIQFSQLQIFTIYLGQLGIQSNNVSVDSVTRLKGPVQSDSWSCGWLSFWVVCHLRFYFNNIFLSSKLEIEPEKVRELFFDLLYKIIYVDPFQNGSLK